jgi:PAS domain S-box-containing protein
MPDFLTKKTFNIYTILTISAAPLIGSLVLQAYFPGWVWHNEYVHMSIEVLGSFSALSLAAVLLLLEKPAEDTAHYLWVACAMISMGIFDFAHALSKQPDIFVFLHSLSMLTGGVLLALVWLPARIVSPQLWKVLPLTVFAATVISSVFMLSAAQPKQSILLVGDFTNTDKLLNLLGGFFFLSGAVRMFVFHQRRDYYRALLIGILGIMFGVSGLLFSLSSLWGPIWWLWHLVRLSAYLLVLGYLFSSYRHATLELLKARMNLELKVQERTNELTLVNQHLLSELAERKRAEQKVQTLVKEQQVILNTLSTGVIYVKDRKMIWSNAAFRTIFGYSQSEADGLDTRSLYADAGDYERLGQKGYESIAKGDTYSMEGSAKKKDGSIFWMSLTGRAVDPDNLSEGSIWTFRDISARKQAEAEKEQFYKFFQSSTDIMVMANAKGAFLITNPACTEILGYSETELVEKPFIEFVHPDDKQSTLDEMTKYLQSGFSLNFENRYICKDGSFRWLSWRATHVKNEGITYAIARDVTERKQAEKELNKIEWLLKSRVYPKETFEPIYGDITTYNQDRTILNALGADTLSGIVNDFMGLLETSSAVCERNGDYAAGIFSSGWCRFLDNASFNLCNTDDIKQALNCGKWICHESCWSEASIKAIENGIPTDIECGGGIRLYAVPIRSGNEIIGAINFGYGDPPQDSEKLNEIATKYQVDIKELTRLAGEYETRPPFIIDLVKHRLIESAKLIGLLVERFENLTERKQSEEKIRQSLKEKESLLREIHHRVKNNLAVVSSLLSLQARKTEDVTVRRLLEESQQRVKSMALVHEKIYHAKDLASINFKDYISSIISEITSLYRINTNAVTTDLHIEDIELDLDLESAVPCGLIINELLTNAYKYAFPDNRDGVISVNFTKTGDTYTLTVKDDGVGLPEGFDYREAATLGLQLVSGLAGQLGGTLQIKSDKGVEAVVAFTNSRGSSANSKGLSQTRRK